MRKGKRFRSGTFRDPLFASQGTEHPITAQPLEQHARYADSEILCSQVEVAAEQPLEACANNLIGQYGGEQASEQHLVLGPTGYDRGGHGQQSGLDEDGGQYGGSRHGEKQVVDYGRQNGCQQTHAQPEFIGGHECKEVDGQQSGASQRQKVAELRQKDVACYEQQGK